MFNPAFDESANDGASDDTSAATSNGETGEAGEAGEAGATGGPDEAGTGTDSTDAGETTDTDNDTLTGSGPGFLEVTANFSACRGTNHGPLECAIYASDEVAAIVIDKTSDNGDYLVACLTFEIDDTLTGTTVNQVILEMHTIDEPWASSDGVGEIWEVEPFSKADFDGDLPLQIGLEPIGTKPGVAAVNAPVQWELPIDLVAENTPIYLCAFPLSGDGTYFYSHAGTIPPKLHIEYE